MLPQFEPTLRAFMIDSKSLGIFAVCVKCGKPILLDAGVLAIDGSGEPTGEVQTVAGVTLEHLEGRVIALHDGCDDRKHWPFVRLTSVIRGDQRSERDRVLEIQEEK